jgi:TolA-binding protein
MYKMAVAEYEKFITSYSGQPEIPRVTFMIGESFFYQKDYQAAVDAYGKYLTRFSGGPDAAHAHLRIAASLIELKEYARALGEASPFLLTSSPPDIRGEALYLTALAEVDSGSKEAGIQHLKAAYDIGAVTSYSLFAAYQLGRIYRDDGDLNAAITFFDAAAIAADKELALLSSLGGAEARFERGDYKEASALFRMAAFGETTPADIRDKAVIGLIRSLNGMREFGEAAGVYEKMKPGFRSGSLRLTAALLAAQAYADKESYGEAIGTLEQYINDPALSEEERESVFFAKVGVLTSAKRLDEARALLASKTAYKDAARSVFMRAEINYYLGSYEEAQKDYSELLDTYRDSPLSAEALYGRAFAALANKQKKTARDSFLELASRFSGDKHSPESLYSAVALDSELGLKEDGIVHAKMYLERYSGQKPAKAVLLLLGRFYTDVKNPEEAIKVYHNFETLYPNDPKMEEVYFLIGYNLQQEGDAKASSGYYSKITKAGSGDEGLYYSARKNIAQNFIKEGDDLAAAKIMDDILTNWAKNDLTFDSYIWVARKYIDAGLFDNVIRIIGLAESRKDAGTKKAACAYFRAEASRGLGRYDEAIAGYEKCIQEYPDKGEYTGAAHLGIGMCRIALKDLARARQALEDAIAFNPADNTVAMRSRYYMGDIFVKEGKPEDAAKMFMMVAILYDDNAFVPEALYKAVLAFDALGKKEEIRKACEDFLERFPKHAKAEEVRKVLRKYEHTTG